MENKRASQEAGNNQHLVWGLDVSPLALASASPRRAEILRSVGWPFEVCPANIDETAKGGESAPEYVERLAHEKAAAVAVTRRFGLTLGADTTVVAPDGEMLGKPRDHADARRMLRHLSGHWHQVITGVALVQAESQRCVVKHELSRVLFADMSEQEIDWYVQTGEPMDKAGAYAIQGRAALFIEAIAGDYWNIVGLPLRLTYRMSREMKN
ncbi:MAG: septum formation inhibitor Maf [Pyrinomonadaceae bacterium]|nr:septum formation inhibitor Maf [Pyrinomonadaceae bacterium]